MWHCDSWRGILLQKPVAFGSEFTFGILLCLLWTTSHAEDNLNPGLTVILPLTEVDDELGPTHLLPGTLGVKDSKDTVPYQLCRILYSQRQEATKKITV